MVSSMNCYHHAEMDTIRESQQSFNNLIVDEVDYSEDAYWLEAALRRESTADVPLDGAGEWRDDVGAGCVEVQQEENLSGPAESALDALPEEEGIEGGLVTTEKRLYCLNAQPYATQKSCQSISSKDNRFVVERGISGI